MTTSQAAQKEAEQTISDVRRERFRVVGAPTTPSTAPALRPTISVDDAPLSAAELETLDFARDALISESRAILDQIERLDRRFCDAVALLTDCAGSVVVTGMGKAGLIGRKLSATLSSTGTPSHFLHPAEAFHGDLGTVRPDDVVLALSYSGETEELSRILAPLRSRSIPIVSIVSTAASSLGRASTIVLEIGSIEEADALRLAPSSSAAAMLAVGDALALAASRSRKFRAEDFAKFHPGGSLGRRLSRVDDLMRPIAQCRVASDALSIREIFVSCRKPGRRVGAILLTDEEGRLTGVFTDADLAKLFETRDADFFDRPISEAMTRFPSVVRSGALMSEALAALSSRKISELPVLDERGVPLGVLDVTDLVDFFPTPFEPTR